MRSAKLALITLALAAGLGSTDMTMNHDHAHMTMNEMSPTELIAQLIQDTNIPARGICNACKQSVDPKLNLHNMPMRQITKEEAAFTNTCDFSPNQGQGVHKINGKLLPNKMGELQDSSVMLDTITTGGLRLVVNLGTRKAKTRVPIHTHKYGGWTCVLQGKITDYLQGVQPNPTFEAGSCYYMPPNVFMAASNEEDTDAQLIDIFVLPVNEPFITFHEPGAYGCVTADVTSTPPKPSELTLSQTVDTVVPEDQTDVIDQVFLQLHNTGLHERIKNMTPQQQATLFARLLIEP